MNQTSKITIRPGRTEDIPAIARVHVDSWQTAYRGIISDSFLASLSYQKHEERHHRYMNYPGTFYFVAELPNDGIVGFLSGGPQRGDHPQFEGEIFAIYLLQEHRRQGIGRSLVSSWAANLQQLGFNSALVWVLADNRQGVAFYERLGGQLLRDQMLDIGGTSLKELAYGWEDLGRCKSIDIGKSR